MGAILLGWSLNYLALPLYGVSQVQHRKARQVVAFELDHPEVFKRMYNRQRVILIAILYALFLLALVQELSLPLRG